MDFVITGIWNKLEKLTELCKEKNLLLENVAYLGDDINDLDVINVCESNEFSKYDLLDLGLITDEEVAEIEAQEEEEWRKNNKEANIIKFKHLSSYLKKLCLTESELVKIVIEAYTK
jgi:hypothetical protein